MERLALPALVNSRDCKEPPANVPFIYKPTEKPMLPNYLLRLSQFKLLPLCPIHPGTRYQTTQHSPYTPETTPEIDLKPANPMTAYDACQFLPTETTRKVFF